MPRFYPPGTRGNDLLTQYAATFRACELNATYYRQPGEAAVRAWAAATPPTFRFAVKAQRGGAARAFLVDPREALAWLTAPYRLLGERLGAVLFRVPDDVPRDSARLDEFLASWPAGLPLVLEVRHPSWHVDETFDQLVTAGVVLCATEADEDPEPPTLRLTGSSLYIRLRRSTYEPAAIEAWAARLEPFLAAGHDIFAFFRHDEVGRATEYARALDEAVAALRA